MSAPGLDRPSRRGYRRRDTRTARTLALLDTIGVTRRKRDVAVYLSDAGLASLFAHAQGRGVFGAGYGSYLIERGLRADRCRAGHDLTPDNLRVESDGTRRCRACKRAYDLANKARREERRRAAREARRQEVTPVETQRVP